MKRKIWRISAVMLAAMLLAACGKEKAPKPGESFVYYTNTDAAGLVKKGYEWKGDTALEEVEDILKVMQNPEDTMEYKSVIPKDVEITDVTIEEGKLDIHFNEAYRQMSKTGEVLCRAAIVQSVTQVGGVDQVGFFVGETPLSGEDGQQIGYMSAEDFVQNTGPALNSYQKATLNLFYANETGDKLVEQTVNIRYNSNMTIEKAIVEQLIKGPKGSDAKGVIPTGTKLLGISVKDGICYVNFSEGFLTANYEVDPNIALQALANSIIEGGEASQVQISVNGETNVTFQGTVDLGKPISRNLDVVEEKK